jgi:colicin import membrane protein
MAAVVVEHRPQQPRSEQNTPAAFLLALAMHALLVGALWISVQWRTEPSGAVVVELWGGPPAAEPIAVAPAPPPPPPPVRAEPEPERPNADIVLKQEKKAPPKVEPPPPDLKKVEAEKRRIEAEKQRVAVEEKRREAEKKQLEAERKKQAEAAAQAAERRRENESREAVRKAEEARMLAQAGAGSSAGSAGGTAGGSARGTAAAGAGGGDAGYVGQLVALIRPRIVFAVPENTPASVYADFQVDLLPTGEILAVRRLRASGLPGYDEAVERAIRRTDPFPRKRDGTVERTVIIRFRPVDAQ